MCVNNLSKVTLDSAVAEIEPAISSRKSNALTITPPSHKVLNAEASWVDWVAFLYTTGTDRDLMFVYALCRCVCSVISDDG